MSRKTRGNAGEVAAERWLLDHGYHILERNFRCKFGEIDLIAFKDNTFVFVEVKYRSSHGSGFAEEAVPFVKQKRICATADYYRMTRRITERYGFRFDLIAINRGDIRHIENAFPYLGSF